MGIEYDREEWQRIQLEAELAHGAFLRASERRRECREALNRALQTVMQDPGQPNEREVWRQERRWAPDKNAFVIAEAVPKAETRERGLELLRLYGGGRVIDEFERSEAHYEEAARRQRQALSVRDRCRAFLEERGELPAHDAPVVIG